MSHHHTLYPRPVSGPLLRVNKDTVKPKGVVYTGDPGVWGGCKQTAPSATRTVLRSRSRPNPRQPRAPNKEPQTPTRLQRYRGSLPYQFHSGDTIHTPPNHSPSLDNPLSVFPPRLRSSKLQLTRSRVGNNPPLAKHPNANRLNLGTPSTSCYFTVTSVTVDNKITRVQQEQRSGRFDDWAVHLEATLDLGNFEEVRKLRLMRSKLYGEAVEKFDNFKLDNPIRAKEYSAVKKRLLKQFHSTETRSQRSVEFNNMKREPEENMRHYANRIRKAFYKSYPREGVLDAATTASREQMMMDRVKEGLQHDLQPRLKHKQFRGIELFLRNVDRQGRTGRNGYRRKPNTRTHTGGVQFT
ncbi:hypothetical protein OUZ56_032099 [Daphnia magna]|uniref:Retrotransposon gag domain-containing protein n=1 Tax=Daphnia magna TaxID=35525 RepID=A0ABQ9ZW49_9CRUS|nr:hypothetical protein OUZ56_032099 [Daphnia magna]